MVPCALDICVATKVLDHSALADGLNPVFSLLIQKKIEALILTPSTVWHNSVKKAKRLVLFEVGHVHTGTAKRRMDDLDVK